MEQNPSHNSNNFFEEHPLGVSLFTDRMHVAREMGKRITSMPGTNLVVATNSVDAFEDAVQSGQTDIQMVSYRSLDKYTQLEKKLGASMMKSQFRYVMTWVNTFEINAWVQKHKFDGVVTHFDYSCRDAQSLFGLLVPSRTKNSRSNDETIEPPIAPISYKDQIDEDIAAMISSGLSDREIADALYLSLQTIRNRVSRMLHDSGARNRTHLAMVYLTSIETFVD